MEKVCEFEAVFDNANLFKDGNLRFRFEVPFADISQVIQTVRTIEKQSKVNVSLIEDDVEFEVKPAYFYRLNIYQEGNSKFEFIVDAKKFDLQYSKISQFVESNARVVLYSSESE